ncbi:MAG: GNAT family N-acetyltransferase [Armatimonadia bacterium]|nr:GNAT family N-acetyltransferase [Armatimonadia bacterium]
MNCFLKSKRWEPVSVPAHWRESCDRAGVVVGRVHGCTQAIDDVCRIRANAYKTAVTGPDAYDAYSRHYVVLHRGRPVGTMRTTRATDGPLDSQDHYPTSLLRALHEVIASASRFCVPPGPPLEVRVARMLVETVWAAEARDGVRVDIINAHRRGVLYYARLGYLLLRDYYFVHPVLSTPSYVLVLPASRVMPGPLRELVGGVDNPVLPEEIEQHAAVATDVREHLGPVVRGRVAVAI